MDALMFISLAQYASGEVFVTCRFLLSTCYKTQCI